MIYPLFILFVLALLVLFIGGLMHMFGRDVDAAQRASEQEQFPMDPTTTGPSGAGAFPANRAICNGGSVVSLPGPVSHEGLHTLSGNPRASIRSEIQVEAQRHSSVTKECKVVFRPKDRKKDFFVVETGEAVGTEDMTNDDMQQELLQAPQGNDKAVLVIGKQGKRWFSSLRLRVGVFELQERLDSEQKSYKEREDAIRDAANRSKAWLKSNVIEKVVAAEAGKVE